MPSAKTLTFQIVPNFIVPNVLLTFLFVQGKLLVKKLNTINSNAKQNKTYGSLCIAYMFHGLAKHFTIWVNFILINQLKFSYP